MTGNERTKSDLEAFSMLLDLWKGENPIKTTKLQVLLAVNGLLLSVVQLNGGLVLKNLPLFLVGFALCLVWTLSIGRTCLFQRAWKIKMLEIAEGHAGDPRFEILDTDAAKRAAPLWLRVFGGVSSKYYLLASPFVFAVGWLAVTIYVM